MIDEASKNGTHFEGRRESEFFLKPGKVFSVGSSFHRFLALNGEMQKLYPVLMDVVGIQDEYAKSSEVLSPGDVIVRAAATGHLLIVSEPSCGQEQLVEAIHAMSPYRGQSIVKLTDVASNHASVVELLKRRPTRCTVVLDIGSDATALDPSLLASLFLPQHQTRVIALSRTVEVADKALGVEHVHQMCPPLKLRPIAQRQAAIQYLLDRRLAELQSSLRCSDMTPRNQEALCRHRWPKNFVSLEEAARRLAAIHRFTMELSLPLLCSPGS